MTWEHVERAASDPRPARPARRVAEQRDVLALQRLAGNAAVALTVQRMPFHQALKARFLADPGYHKFHKKGGHLANGDTADRYVATSVAAQPTLLAALGYAAGRFAAVGAAVLRVGWNLNGVIHPRQPNQIEPFVYDITVPYTEDKQPHSITLRYQYAIGTPGYVIAQHDTREAPTTMANARLAANAGRGFAPTFASAHAHTELTPLSSLVRQNARLTQRENEVRADARTKLAGEGARFRFVRTHLATIADWSRVYTSAGGDKVAWVRFDTLWQNWAAVFGGAFDVDDATVAAALRRPANWTVAPTVERLNYFKPTATDIRLG